ncbi:hypothetical protein [Methanosarcina siciliae]|nr:hypothetical protein [Methanosarcina siciliae]
MPTQIGKRMQVVAYIDPETFERIEEMRGKEPRSAFLGEKINEIVNANAC